MRKRYKSKNGSILRCMRDINLPELVEPVEPIAAAPGPAIKDMGLFQNASNAAPALSQLAGTITVDHVPVAKHKPWVTKAMVKATNHTVKGQFKKGNQAAKKVKLSSFGGVLDAKTTPQYRRFYKKGMQYVKQRRRELQQLHGNCSAGVCAILNSGGLALAHGTYFNYLALQEVADPDRSLELILKSTKFFELHQKHELAAYTLAFNENKYRPKESPYELLQKAMGGPMELVANPKAQLK